jgi:hypothetical protein
MVNHPNRNQVPKTEVDGARFKLSLDPTGNPNLLKEWQQDCNGRWRWTIVWDASHGDRLAGVRAIALLRLVSPPTRGAATARRGTVTADTTRGRAR